MINIRHSVFLIAVIAAVTIILRFLPFILFSQKLPKIVSYLGTVLPCAIIAMLVVYCLKDISLTDSSHGIPESVSVLLVIIIHKWKHNTLFSILTGTIFYMLILQLLS